MLDSTFPKTKLLKLNEPATKDSPYKLTIDSGNATKVAATQRPSGAPATMTSQNRRDNMAPTRTIIRRPSTQKATDLARKDSTHTADPYAPGRRHTTKIRRMDITTTQRWRPDVESIK